jgi:hypothetical protein
MQQVLEGQLPMMRHAAGKRRGLDTAQLSAKSIITHASLPNCFLQVPAHHSLACKLQV